MSDKIHKISLKYSEDSNDIKTSMTVVRLGFIDKIVKEYQEHAICLNCKYYENGKCGTNYMTVDEDFGCNKYIENERHIENNKLCLCKGFYKPNNCPTHGEQK